MQFAKERGVGDVAFPVIKLTPVWAEKKDC
jgi:hypothetical protein